MVVISPKNWIVGWFVFPKISRLSQKIPGLSIAPRDHPVATLLNTGFSETLRSEYSPTPAAQREAIVSSVH
jgi:hypothetical protein